MYMVLMIIMFKIEFMSFDKHTHTHTQIDAFLYGKITKIIIRSFYFYFVDCENDKSFFWGKFTSDKSNLGKQTKK